MSKTLQFRRYTTSNLASIVGASGELIVDLSQNTITVHDSVTPGGWVLVTSNYLSNTVNVVNSNTQSSYNQANTATAIAQSGYNLANTTNVVTQSAYSKANSANVLAQAAFDRANTKFNSSGGVISGDTTVTGNLTVTGVAFYANVTNLDIETTAIFLNAGLDGNTAPTQNGSVIINRGSSLNTFIRWSETDKFWQLSNDGSTYSPIATYNTVTSNTTTLTNTINAANTFLQSNDATTLATAKTYANTIVSANVSTLNTTINTANTFLQANDASTLSLAQTYSNNIGSQANNYANTIVSANISLVSGYISTNSAFTQSAYTQANTANTVAQSVYSFANNINAYAYSAYSLANTTSSSLSGTISQVATQNTYAFSAYSQANNAYNWANTVNVFTQSAYSQANSVSILAQAAFDKANTDATYPGFVANSIPFANTTGYLISNSNFLYFSSNNTLVISNTKINGGTASTSNTTGALTVTGGVGVTGNIYANSVYTNLTNTAIIFFPDGTSQATAGGVIDIPSRQLANAAFDKANSANVLANSAYAYANGLNLLIQNDISAIASLNTFAFGAYSQANSANVLAQSSFNQANSANILAQSAYNTANTKFNTSGGTISGNVIIQQNLTVQGNVNFTGNSTSVQVTGNTGQFFGYSSNGFNALYAGIPTGYLIQPQMVFQMTSNFNGYAGLNMQNINSGNNSSSDLFVTADNGTSLDGYLDLGMASSTYSYPGFGLIGKNDAYLLAYGNTSTGGGNLIISTGLQNDIIFSTYGTNSNNEVMRITGSNTVIIKSNVKSSNTTSGALTISGGLGVSGNVYASNVYISGLYYAANGNPYTPPSVTLSDSISSNSSTTAATSNAVYIAVGTALAFSIALG